MRAVITVVGKDMVGILAKISAGCAENNINIIDVTQTVLDNVFAMVMLVDISESSLPFEKLKSNLESAGTEMGLAVHIMHEDIFNAMHKI